MKLFRATLGVLLLVLIVFPATLAQESNDDIKAEIEALKKGQQGIQKQLQELKRLIQAQQKAAQPRRKAGPAVKDVVFNVANSVLKGDNSAKLTLLEFTDYQ